MHQERFSALHQAPHQRQGRIAIHSRRGGRIPAQGSSAWRRSDIVCAPGISHADGPGLLVNEFDAGTGDAMDR